MEKGVWSCAELSAAARALRVLLMGWLGVAAGPDIAAWMLAERRLVTDGGRVRGFPSSQLGVRSHLVDGASESARLAVAVVAAAEDPRFQKL